MITKVTLSLNNLEDIEFYYDFTPTLVELNNSLSILYSSLESECNSCATELPELIYIGNLIKAINMVESEELSFKMEEVEENE